MGIESLRKIDLFKQTETILQTTDIHLPLKTFISLPVLIYICADDKKIKKNEISSMKRYTSYLLNLDKKTAVKIVHLYILSYRDDPRIRKMIPEFIEAIKETLSYKEKLELLETLLVLSRSDLDMSSSEKQKIRDIAFKIEVSERDCENEIINHAITLADKVHEQISKDPALQTDEDEVKKIEIVSTKEYYRHLFDS